MTPEFHRPIALPKVGTAPVEGEIEADAAERAALARRFGLAALDRLIARYRAVRDGDDLLLSGTLEAELTQHCVRSLAEVPEHISESFAIRFSPPGGGDEVEIEIDPEPEEDVDLLEGDSVDIGEAVAQSLSLALDPFPRAPGTAPVGEEGGEDALANPAFAILKKLRDNA